jgi:3D (Asp-Asp-Asp) domain-containing protein
MINGMTRHQKLWTTLGLTALALLLLTTAVFARHLASHRATTVHPSVAPATSPSLSASASPAGSSTRPGSPTKPAPATTTTGGWRVTTYYTPVERYHGGAGETVHGCTTIDCTNGDATLGTFPADFVETVRTEGAGRLTSGPNAGRYLNWADDTGFWLDSAPRDAQGQPLAALRTAAADPSVLPAGTTFRLASCGTNADAISAPACSQLKQATWRVSDQFGSPAGGAKHIDLYLGEEDRPNFEQSSPLYVEISGVSLTR